MSHKMQPARGTKDILQDEMRCFNYVVENIKEISSNFGFEEISTPVFEFTELFARGIGDETDIVSKEMYTFEDRGGESITLRPEFTAGVVRSFISNGLMQHAPLKLFTYGPLFRYERPQKARYRQFHQVNFEILGADSPLADIEIISLAAEIVGGLGLSDKISLELNSLGDEESRSKYLEALVNYLSKYKNDLSDDSKKRLDKNPMRILDSKDEGDKKILKDAPLITDYYNNDSKRFFDVVQKGLNDLQIKYNLNSKLVRGLDYYSHTAFEFTTDLLGSQNAVLAGGRYDSLVEKLGGAKAPSIGFAGGIERLMALLDVELNKKRPVVIVPIGKKAEEKSTIICYRLRQEGFCTETAYSGNLTKRMKKAGKINAKAVVIFGDEELEKNRVIVKDFDRSEEKSVNIDIDGAVGLNTKELADYLKKIC